MALKKPTHDELRRAYLEGESVDKEIFAEQRTNILLIAGDHYAKKKSKFMERVRDAKGLAEEQKIRLTKNHVYKIMRGYSNAITSFCPGVMPTPNDDKSLQDIKAAELHHKVQKYAKNKYRIKEKCRDWADDFTGIGEVGCKIYFDPNLGKQVGWEQETDEEGKPVFETDELGMQIMDPQTGQPTPKQSDRPVYSGDFVFENFYGFNLIREKHVKNMGDATKLFIRKMVDIPKMKDQYAKDPEKLKMFTSSSDETMVVFDAHKGAYGSAENQCMVVECFMKPCMAYPEGWYSYFTETGIFEEGPLPFGIWPIAYAPFDKYQTSPRGRSHIKVLRPFQAEINRAASKVAEHQITLGDDKLISQAGSTITQGNVLPGIRGYEVSGAPPTILPGRDGSQYVGYLNGEIAGMYKASLIEEEQLEKATQVDPYSMLFKAASEKKKFSVYTERFEQFQADFWTIFLELARHYMADAELLEAIGHSEQGNVSEFRNPTNLNYQIKLEPQSEDLESKLGRQLTLTQALQYVGPKLEKEDIGKILSNMPYGNLGESMKDLTMNYDMSVNVILALDRGEFPPVTPSQPHDYLIKRLESRTLEGDFRFLPPQIQQAYQQAIAQHSQIQSQQVAQLKAMEADFIPTNGAMIVCDMYVPDPTSPNPEASKRVRVPYESLNWLIQRLTQQGSTLGSLEDMHQRNMIEIGQHAGIPSGNPAQNGHMAPQPNAPSLMPQGPKPQYIQR